MQPERSNAVETIGPYRILERLGAGGMGEVFLAYDDRLDRRVAIKRIRPDAGAKPDRRERFRREARMAARLSHPAIVQVYDILQENDLDYIIMEYVEGATLRKMVERGPLPVRQVLELARELADGLEAAHREGIVHRDLKAENVLVTFSGRPKIMDFGIAKRLLAEEGEESLTAEDAVVGTCRSMSPEQARGEPVDHRTDLFALGVLLYEMLTGTSPFAAENRLATLNRVIHSRQRPIRELASAVPGEVSRLVDDLLEKEPYLRPQSAGQVRRVLDRLSLATVDRGGAGTTIEDRSTGSFDLPTVDAGGVVFVRQSAQRPGEKRSLLESALTVVHLRRRSLVWLAGIALLVGFGIWSYLALRSAEPPLYVAVLAPEIGIGAGNSEFELLASGVRVAVLQGLVLLEGISPQAFEEVDAASGSPREIARAVAADELVGTRLDCRSEVCRVSLTRRRGSDGSVVWAESFDVATDDLSLVAQAVARQAQSAYAERRRRDGATEPEVRKADFEAFLRLRQRFGTPQEAISDSLLQGLQAIRRSSPRFLEAHLLEAEVGRYRFWHSRNPQDLEGAFQRIAEARELAPADPRPLLFLAELALARSDLELARTTLAHLEELLPGDARLLDCRSRLLEAEGKAGEALELKREAIRLQPSSYRLFNLAQAEYRQGEIAAAREHLEQLLQRSPGHVGGLSLVALLEMSNGDLNRAIQIYSDLVRRSESPAQRSNLGLAYFIAGRYPEAAAIFRGLLAKEPKNPRYILNLADTYSLMGRPAEAREAYRRVVALAEADIATTPQLLTVKAQALAHLGQGPQAVTALQEALRLAPDQGPVAYEAAVVYSLLGEEDSALVSAEKAIRSGLGPHWFSFPWFEALRKHPGFRDVLAAASPPSRS
ncbi:MAG TPA: protein kinase [Thermoanaerobaculia bacterium]|nr:protein kinase [Thermoanaerobaculia bacterium]